MTQMKQKSPLALIKGVVSARHSGEIEQTGYLDALKVLDRHFEVYEQRLRVMSAPASFPDGEVMLEAAEEGLTKLRAAVEGLKEMDPSQEPEEAKSLVSSAEEGYSLLLQLQDVTEEKRKEFEEAYEALIEEGEEIG